MPPIEVFVALDALRSGSETISSQLPTRTELRAWIVEHDKIEKETEIFDAGEFRELKKFTKGNVSLQFSPQSGYHDANFHYDLQPLRKGTYPPQTLT